MIGLLFCDGDGTYEIVGRGIAHLVKIDESCNNFIFPSAVSISQGRELKVVGVSENFRYDHRYNQPFAISFGEAANVQRIPLSFLLKINATIFLSSKIKRITCDSCEPDFQEGKFMHNIKINIDKSNQYICILPHKYILFKQPLEIQLVHFYKPRISFRETIRVISRCLSCEKLNIKSVIFPPSVETISDFAFYKCERLQKITFRGKSRMKTIGKSAFCCTKIRKIEFPSTLEEIGEKAFFKISNLSSISFTNDSKLKRLGKSAFDFITIQSICFPSELMAIPDDAFARCRNLRSISFQENSKLKRIGARAFFNLELSRISFPKDSMLKIIEEGAFSNTKIETLEIPASLEKIMRGAFMDCKNLSSITFQEGSKLKEIGHSAFKNAKIKDITFPASLKLIGMYAFRNCEELSSVVFPASLEGIYSYSFFNCRKLESAHFPPDSRLRYIGKEAFGFTNIKSINLAGSLEFISNSAFFMTKLRSISFQPVTVSGKIDFVPIPFKIDEKAFEGCVFLTSVAFPSDSKLKSIGRRAFNKTSIVSIKIPASVEEIGYKAFSNCSKLVSVTFCEGSKLETIQSRAFESTSVFSISFPSSVRKIGYEAFSNCTNLSRIFFKEDSKMRLIQSQAFANTGLFSVKIPKSAFIIAHEVFSNCKNLQVMPTRC